MMIKTIPNINPITHNTITGFKRLTDFSQFEGMFNRVMMADSYKYSHVKQYPKNTTAMFDYAEARSGKVYDVTVFNGLQPKLKKFFITPIQQWEVDEAYMYAQAHGVDFAIEGWDYIVQTLGGNMPVEIRAVAEGSVIPVKNALFTVKSTDENVFWSASWFETVLMTVWYPCNVATRSYYVRKMLMKYAELTMDNPFVDFQYHNFGARGSTNPEAVLDGGMAHLITGFMGSDAFSAMRSARTAYNVEDIASIMQSINASEHSSVTAWTRINEMDMILNHIEENKGKAIIACVMDSYDYFNAVRQVCREGGVFQEKINSPEYPVFVMRPDSGDPKEILNGTLDIMESSNVPFVRNDKGYKVFNKMRIIWGDGINMESMRIMLDIMVKRGYSTENIAFGSGGWLMQQHDRDTQGWAVKCSEITLEDGTKVDVYKDPITAPNKKSKKGEITLYYNKETKTYFTDRINMDFESSIDVLDIIYRNGKMVKEYTLAEARVNANKPFGG